MFVLAKSVFYFTVKADFSFEALATKEATIFFLCGTQARGRGRGGQAERELESSLSRFRMTITFTSGQILERKLKQN